MSANKKILSWNFTRDKLSDSLRLQFSSGKPIFYQIIEKNEMEVPSLFTAKKSDIISTNIEIEKVSEFAGFDEN